MQGLLDVVFSTEIKSFLFETKTLQAVGANCLEKAGVQSCNILQIKTLSILGYSFLKILYHIFSFPRFILFCDHVPPCLHRHFARCGLLF